MIFSFQNGVVIVDSPAIGEPELMDEEVVKYLPEDNFSIINRVGLLEEFKSWRFERNSLYSFIYVKLLHLFMSSKETMPESPERLDQC